MSAQLRYPKVTGELGESRRTCPRTRRVGERGEVAGGELRVTERKVATLR